MLKSIEFGEPFSCFIVNNYTFYIINVLGSLIDNAIIITEYDFY